MHRKALPGLFSKARFSLRREAQHKIGSIRLLPGAAGG